MTITAVIVMFTEHFSELFTTGETEAEEAKKFAHRPASRCQSWGLSPAVWLISPPLTSPSLAEPD